MVFNLNAITLVLLQEDLPLFRYPLLYLEPKGKPFSEEKLEHD